MRLRVLIVGVTGQDGAYLARHLVEQGMEVTGTSRDAALRPLDHLTSLGVRDTVRLRSMAASDAGSVLQVVREVAPHRIYNLSGQTSVGLSFEQPRETFESITIGTLNLLEAVRAFAPDARYYNACSSECFGDTGSTPATENSPFRPRSPYGVAKAAAHWQVVNYREAYGIFSVSGILFNHESPLRPARFVTRKIVRGACAIARGDQRDLVLGDLDVIRDWGWAPEYVVAMHKILEHDAPRDFLVSTGESHSLREFVEMVFSALGLDADRYVRTDPALYRPSDVRESRGDPSRARCELGWSASVRLPELVHRMVSAEMER